MLDEIHGSASCSTWGERAPSSSAALAGRDPVDRRAEERRLADEDVPGLDGPAAWRALVEGRLRIVEVLAQDGRCYVVARLASGVVPCPLSPREAEVVGLVARGYSNKLVAYELGVATSTVAQLVSRAMVKLGVRNRVELIRSRRSAEVLAGSPPFR